MRQRADEPSQQRRTEQRRLAATRGATGSTAATVSQPVVTFSQPIAMQAPSQTPPMAPYLPQFTFHPEYQPHITFATAPSTSSATQAHHADQEGHGISLGESADRTHGSAHTTEYVEAAEARGAEFERRIREAMAKEGLDPILLYDFDDEEEGMEPAEDTDYVQGLGEDPLPAPSAPPRTNSSTPLPVPSHVPEDTDPFHYQHEDARPLPTPADVHPHTAVYIIYFTVFWLHSYFHLPYRACDALLSIFALILAVCRVKLNPTMHTTLKSVMAALGAEPSFKTCAVCPSCLEVYPPDIGKRTTCAACNTPLFDSQPTSAGQRNGQTERKVPIPRLQFPYKSLAEQLATLLAIPEMEDEIERSQTKASTCEHGRYSSIFHGRVCQELRAADEEKFFFLSDKQREDGELRLGVSLGVDWFSYHRSLISPSHTSGPMSYCLINLPPHLRYRAANLLLAGIMPGPTEPNGDQVQRFLRILVNELLRLWREGVVIKTTKYPQGRLVRVALVAVVCDKPAAHKLGGFASHNHRCFCTLCWITQDDKTSKKAWERDAFRRRTDTEHRGLQKAYLACDSKAARSEFVKEHATRWSELSRLPYFDVCQMVVVDPMHNLFLGVVKTHFYHIWVQQGILRKNKELRRLHSMLEEISLPARLGRLPSLIGEPAGGSLTADQWRVLATVIAPLIIPQLWSEYAPAELPAHLVKQRCDAIMQRMREKRDEAAQARRQQNNARKDQGTTSRNPSAAPSALHPSGRPKRTFRPTAKAAAMDIGDDSDDFLDAGAIEQRGDTYGSRPRKRRKTKHQWANPPPVEIEDESLDDAPPPNLHPDDAGNFMKLCEALKIFCHPDGFTDEELDKADNLMREYMKELLDLYGPGVMRPNHHYATHTAQAARNYGPLQEFWTFLFERLNKILKTYKTSNHSGGQLEVSFFREFHRTVQDARLLEQASREPADSPLHVAAAAMLKAGSDTRGTVQGLSHADLDAGCTDEGISYELSIRSDRCEIDHSTYFQLLQYIRSHFPHTPMHAVISLAPTPQSKPLPAVALSFDYVILNGRRYTAAARLPTSVECFLATKFSTDAHSVWWIGQLQHIYEIPHPSSHGQLLLAHVKWFKPAPAHAQAAAFWRDLSLTVSLWCIDEPANDRLEGPEIFIPLERIAHPAARSKVHIDGKDYWAAILLD